MSYLKCISYMLLVSLSIYLFGLIENKEKSYKENIIIYIILFMLLLTSFVFILKRPTIHFYKNWYSGQLQPFHTIMSQIEKASPRTYDIGFENMCDLIERIDDIINDKIKS